MSSDRPYAAATTPSVSAAFNPSKLVPYALLALANLFWAGNWVIGRSLRDAVLPVTLNFWRWVPVVLILAPFTLRNVIRHWPVLRRRWKLILLLGLTGVTIFQTMLYFGLARTTAVNAVLLNSSMPAFMILATWAAGQETVTVRQTVGMLISLLGILVILNRGVFADLLRFDFHGGDLIILGCMPVWAVYSVLLKSRPPELNGQELVFVVSAAGLILLAPIYAAEAYYVRPVVTPVTVAAVLYTSCFASLGAFICWNRAVAALGANVASFSMHLLPAFGTMLAVIFLGEQVHLFHAVGIATILAGVFLATWRPPANA